MTLLISLMSIFIRQLWWLVVGLAVAAWLGFGVFVLASRR